MSTITLEVDDETAQAFQSILPDQQEKLQELFSLLLHQMIGDRTLQDIMDDISQKARDRGLTPEILEDLLSDES
jgi:Tfp pilus assembly protein PilO